MNLARGRIGEGPTALLGSLLVSSLALAGFERADTPEEEGCPCYVYFDEFHVFATLSVATMLSELRKYRVSLVLAQLYLGQLEPEVRDAVLGNTGTCLGLPRRRPGCAAPSPGAGSRLNPEDLVELPNCNAFIRLMIGAAPSKAFSMETLPPEGSEKQVFEMHLWAATDTG